MTYLIMILTVAGGVLPGLGVLLAWRDVGGRRRHLRRKMKRVEQIMNEENISEDQRDHLLSTEVPSESTWNDVLYTRERIELNYLEKALPDLTLPALLAGGGILSGMTAGLISTWAG